MTEEQDRKRWLRQHSQYEKIAYKKLMVGFRDLGNSIPFGFMTEDNYDAFLSVNLKQEQFTEIYYNIYKEIGEIHGARVGRQINKDIKEFSYNIFTSEFGRNLLGWLFNNVSERIVIVRETYLDYLKEIITKRIGAGDTISEVVTELQRRINQRNFYRWQALRIARTETTAAANYSALQAGKSSGVVMEKVWISAVDARTRRPPKSEFNHIKMNMVRVGQDEDFKVPFNGKYQDMEFPGDPKGSAGNNINCRCSVTLAPKRDANGRLIMV